MSYPYWVPRAGALGVLIVGLSGAAAVAADDPAPAPAGAATANGANDLQLEVEALSTLSDLQLSADQIGHLRDLAKGTAGVVQAPESPVSGDVLSATRALRIALLAGKDAAVDDAEQKLGDLEDQTDADPDPTVDLSEAAKGAAPAALKLLSPRQMAAFLGEISDGVPDASDIILAIDDSHELAPADFDAERDRLAEDLGTMKAGLRPGKNVTLISQVKQLLNRARRTPDDQFAGKLAGLHAEAASLLEGIDPIVALRHCSERELAELLSNPQLPHALDEWKPVPQNNAD